MLREGQKPHTRYMRVVSEFTVTTYPSNGLTDRGIVNGIRIIKRQLGCGNETRMLGEMLEKGQIVGDTIYYRTEQDAIDGVDRGSFWQQPA